MIEIWTEDNGAGFEIIKNIIESIYGTKYISVKEHNGNGTTLRTTTWWMELHTDFEFNLRRRIYE